jgi:tripartite-type tricarboxylate transporter receptor subunit TctC
MKAGPLVAALLLLCFDAAAQGFPSKPVRMIVAFPPGGGTDVVARIVGQKLTEVWSQQVVVDNRAGAGGIVGAELAARAQPDGYTVFLATTGNLAINPALYSKLPYDTLKDFAPVTLVVALSFVLVSHPSLPASTLKELIALAKSKPGQLNYASGGSGTASHLGMELFKATAGVNIVHVPYKGSAPALTDLLSGQVQLALGDGIVTLPHIKSGKLRALAVTGARRAPLLPDVPTIAEAGVAGYAVVNWYGVVAPAGTRPEIISVLNKAIARVLQSTDVRDRLIAQGVEPVSNTPAEFGAYLKAEVAKWAKLVADSGARAN